MEIPYKILVYRKLNDLPEHICIITEIKYSKGGFSNGLDTAKHILANGQ